MNTEQTPGAPTEQGWAETLEGEVRGWFPTPEGYADPDEWAAQITLYAAALITREREAAKAEALREAADSADSVGHHWSGAPARAFFALADGLRAKAQAPQDPSKETDR